MLALVHQSYPASHTFQWLNYTSKNNNQNQINQVSFQASLNTVERQEDNMMMCNDLLPFLVDMKHGKTTEWVSLDNTVYHQLEQWS